MTSPFGFIHLWARELSINGRRARRSTETEQGEKSGIKVSCIKFTLREAALCVCDVHFYCRKPSSNAIFITLSLQRIKTTQKLYFQFALGTFPDHFNDTIELDFFFSAWEMREAIGQRIPASSFLFTFFSFLSVRSRGYFFCQTAAPVRIRYGKQTQFQFTFGRWLTSSFQPFSFCEQLKSKMRKNVSRFTWTSLRFLSRSRAPPTIRALRN